MMKTIRILCGIPNSGKSTYASGETHWLNTEYVSRDDIREDSEYFIQPYCYSNEKVVTKIFNLQVAELLITNYIGVVILDNTHCKEKYIDEIITKYGDIYNIEIKFFDISLIKAHYRNIIRRFKTGKWIPIKIMNAMHRNYVKINRDKYKQYIIK